MIRRFKYSIVLIVAALLNTVTATGGNTIVTAKLDSTRVMMGKTVKLHINVVQDLGATGIFINTNGDNFGGIDIVGRDKIQTKEIDNNREEITQTIILQPFEPGGWELPPVLYYIDGDTSKSNQEKLLVDSMKVDPKGKIKDFKPIVGVPFKILDYIPNVIANYWWAWLAGILLLAFAIFAYLKWYKKGVNPFKPVKKRLPPYEEAMLALNNLKKRQLWQNGQEKEYYTQLTDILRVYIDRRFGINAVEMTSQEIMKSLQENEETHLHKEKLSEVLEIADFVKFAKMRTIANDNEMSFQRVLNFVEQTKPLPVSEEEKENNGTGTSNDRKEGDAQ